MLIRPLVASSFSLTALSTSWHDPCNTQFRSDPYSTSTSFMSQGWSMTFTLSLSRPVCLPVQGSCLVFPSQGGEFGALSCGLFLGHQTAESVNRHIDSCLSLLQSEVPCFHGLNRRSIDLEPKFVVQALSTSTLLQGRQFRFCSSLPGLN